MDSKNRDVEVRFINEYRSWLTIIKIVSEEKKKEKETFV